MFLSNELSLSHLVARYTFTQVPLSKILSTVGGIFQIFCPVEVRFIKFTSVLSQVRCISLSQGH